MIALLGERLKKRLLVHPVQLESFRLGDGAIEHFLLFNLMQKIVMGGEIERAERRTAAINVLRRIVSKEHRAGKAHAVARDERRDDDPTKRIGVERRLKRLMNE